jgi:2-iminobutanoate/2-iminopropanoate deaminase
MKEIVDVPGIPAIGPYSQAVKAGGLLFVSGQPGINPATGLAGATFGEQARPGVCESWRCVEGGWQLVWAGSKHDGSYCGCV